jgi:hypothetical protein
MLFLSDNLLPAMKLSTLFLLFLLLSCTSSLTYIDRKTDLDQGLDVVTRFYAAVKEGKLNKAYSLCYFGTDSTLVRDQRIQFYNMLRKNAALMGDITTYSINSNHSKVIETSGKKNGQYIITVNVNRSRFHGKLRNTFNMLLVKGDIKIIGYQNYAVK